jgi:glycosyltransferase involved in cell wall biosynthesis
MRSNQTTVDANLRAVTSVHELLSLDGKEFLRLAYLTLLRRQPDPGGMAHYLEKLKAGAQKSALLYELHHSAEGERVRRTYSGSNISGLETLLRNENPRPIRLVPPLIARLTNFEDKKLNKDQLSEISRHLSTVESQVDSKLCEIQNAIRDSFRPQVKEAIKNLFSTFDPDSYLEANRDVKEVGMNPFEHYMRYGWLENRALKSDYQEWIRQHDTLDDVCRSALRTRSRTLKNRPLISIIMPTYNPQLEWLQEAIESVREQIYENWQLCIADDCSTNPDVRALLESYSKQDSRIKIVLRPANGHISAASNSALTEATGEWMALLDHDDILPEHALYFVAETINSYPNVCLIYSDEDKLDGSGKRCDPYFKCDWNQDLFYSQNLISHLGVYRKSIVDQIGGFREGYEGSQDYDLALRFIEKIAPSQVHHIPRVLYHWRAHPQSTAHAAAAKPYAAIVGEKALNEHFERLGVNARSEYCGHGYRARYALPAKPRLVSLIIPTRNAHRLVRQCIESIRTKTLYRNYEIILVDNGSDDPESLRYFDELSTAGVRVIRDDRPFNYSALNNSAVQLARGEIIGLINNDVEVIEPGWLCEMVSHAERLEVGAVGAKLLYPNNTVQHAGVVLGLGGVACHSHKHFDHDASGYFGRLKLISSFSAVTAACLVIRKDVFHQVGGLDEDNLTIAFNDVDFCLKVREAGYRNIFTPYTLLYHHESVTRGQDDTPEKRKRFSNEVKYMKKKWGSKLLIDPAYSPNLTLDREDFGLASTPRVELLGDE